MGVTEAAAHLGISRCALYKRDRVLAPRTVQTSRGLRRYYKATTIRAYAERMREADAALAAAKAAK